jgi:hypothetical protein
MSLSAALVLIAQIAAPSAAPAPAQSAAHISVQVKASVTVRRPARISITADGEAEIDGDVNTARVQRNRDAAGTVWFEFS